MAQSLAVILLGHGSRVEAANKPLIEMAGMVSRLLGGARVEGAFLQMASPSLEDAVAALVAEGHRDIALVPFFLYSGAHVTEDIPQKAAELRAAHPGVGIFITQHLGVHPLLAELVVERVRCATERSI